MKNVYLNVTFLFYLAIVESVYIHYVISKTVDNADPEKFKAKHILG